MHLFRKWGIFALIGALYLILSSWFPITPTYADALSDVLKFRPTLALGMQYFYLVGLLFVLCWIAAQHAASQQLSLRQLLLVASLYGIPFIPAYPANANDIFRYYLRGKVTAVHGGNPFSHPPNLFVREAYIHLGGEWVSATSPYGPLWELIDAAVVWVTSSDLFASLLMFKAFGLLCMLLTGIVIWHLLSPEQRIGRTALWLFNPAGMLMFVMDAHNDALMLLLLLLGIWLIKRKNHPLLGLAAMTLAILTKLIALPVVLLYGLYTLQNEPTVKARVRLFGLAILNGVLLSALLFAPFGNPQALVTRLLQETLSGGGFSPFVWLYFLLSNQFGLEIQPIRFVEAGNYLLIVGALLIGLLALIKQRRPERSSAELFALYLLTSFKYRIWYSLWIFPWALIDARSRGRLVASYVFIATSQLSVILYSHVRIFYFDRNSVLIHLFAVPFVFALPVVVGLLVNRFAPAKRSALLTE